MLEHAFVGAADDDQIGLFFFGSLDHFGNQTADDNIDTHFEAPLKEIFRPVNKSNIGSFPQSNFLIFAVPHPTHGKAVPFNDINEYDMV